MTNRPRPHHPLIRRVQTDRRHPPVTLDELALMLELELALGHRKAFRRRLWRSLEDAMRQGAKQARRILTKA